VISREEFMFGMVVRAQDGPGGPRRAQDVSFHWGNGGFELQLHRKCLSLMGKFHI